jgi:photosystem II stability/assembly factor-like uncharacterized protein
MRLRAALPVLLVSLTLPLHAADLWRPLGPGGGFVLRAAADPLAPGRLFAVWTAGESREVYRRDPGATAWSLANRGIEGKRPDALALHPARPGTLWAATLHPLAVYQSADAGASWRLRFTGRIQDQPYGLWSLRRGRDAVLLGWFGPTVSGATGATLYRSRNDGHTWAAVAGVRGPVAVVAGTSTAFALAADGRGLLASRDAGAAWTPGGALPVDADRELILSFVALPGPRSVLLVSFAESGLFRSADQGATWSRVGPAGAGPASLVAAPRALFAAFPNGLHRSVDGGATWRPLPAAGFPPGFVSLLAEPSSAALYALSQERSDLSQSLDRGRTWTPVAPRGVQQLVARDFAWHPLQPRVQALVRGELPAFGEIDELLSTTDGGATWRSAPFKAFAFAPADPGLLYGGGDAGVSVTRDGGATWTDLRSEPATTLAHSGRALFAGGCGVARSADDGAHWTETLPCQAPPSPSVPGGGLLLATRLVAHPTDPDVIWAEVFESFTLNGHPEGHNALYGSFDGGVTWERRGGLAHIALAPGRPDTVWDSAGGVLRRSDDRGLTWTRIFLGGEFHDIAVDPQDANRIYAVGDSVAMESRDNGATWAPAFDLQELAPWGEIRQILTRVFPHPTLPGRIAVAPIIGLLLRRAPV